MNKIKNNKIRKTLAVLTGLSVGVIGIIMVTVWSADLTLNPTPLPYDPPDMIAPMLGFALMCVGSVAVGFLSFQIGFLIYGPSNLKGAWKICYNECKELGVWVIAGSIVIFVLLLSALWWFSVSIVPWCILFIPTILSAFIGRRR